MSDRAFLLTLVWTDCVDHPGTTGVRAIHLTSSLSLVSLCLSLLANQAYLFILMK